jgi:hypothetical protein
MGRSDASDWPLCLENGGRALWTLPRPQAGRRGRLSAARFDGLCRQCPGIACGPGTGGAGIQLVTQDFVRHRRGPAFRLLDK